MPTGAALLPASCRPAGGQIFPARMDADRGEKIFFDKNSGKIRWKRSKNSRNPLFFNAFKKFMWGGVDKRFYPVLIFNHADGVKPRNKTTETKGERNNE
jgi:hypothetical protein